VTATPKPLRVAVLMGGQSSEHDVSISSGLQVLASLDRTKYEPVPVEIRRDGTWLIGGSPQARSLESLPDGSAPREAESARSSPAAPHGGESGIERLRSGDRVDVVFIALHGACGEDGTVQGLLTLLGLPFTGSGVLASALAMDKIQAKEMFRLRGIPVAKQCIVSRRDFARTGERGALLERIASEVGLPCVVKPVIGGSSVATHVAATKDALLAAIDDALSVDARALVEEQLVGTEVTCGVLGGGPFEDAVALPVTEIVPKGGTFFDFRAKYTKGASEEITPARIDAVTTRRVQDLAITAHDALGCEGMSRTDFIIRGGVPIALETNTIPGLTPMSLLPQSAAAAGIPFRELLDKLIASALLRAGKGMR
jgi:D-alanine-D-alanine ligase